MVTLSLIGVSANGRRTPLLANLPTTEEASRIATILDALGEYDRVEVVSENAPSLVSQPLAFSEGTPQPPVLHPRVE